MVNRSKNKGTSHESDVVKYLKEKGWTYADRLTLSGSNDRGDIRLGDGIKFTIECKNEKQFDLSGYIKELQEEIKNSNSEVGAVWIKRPRYGSPGDHYILMTGDMLIYLLKKAGYGV